MLCFSPEASFKPSFTLSCPAMPVHDTKAELVKFLKRKEWYSAERMQKLASASFDNMEDIAHSLGDLQGPSNDKRTTAVMKLIEGDWDIAIPKKDGNGNVVKKVKTTSQGKDPNTLTPADYEDDMEAPGQNNRTCNKWGMVFWHCRTATLQAEVTRQQKGEDASAPKMTEDEKQG